MVKSVRPSISNRPSSRPGKQKRPPKYKSRTLDMDEKKLLVYRRPKGVSEDDFGVFLRRAAQDILTRLNISTVVVGVNNWNEIKLLDEVELEQIGFIHKDRVFLTKDQVDLTKYTEEEILEIVTAFLPRPDEEE